MDEIEFKRNEPISSGMIEALRKSVGWETKPDIYSKAFPKTYCHFTVEKAGEVIGFARIISDGVLYSFIVDLIIKKEYQSVGIGKQFVKHMVSELKSDGIKFIQLTFYKELESFYKNCGFNIIEAGSIVNENY